MVTADKKTSTRTGEVAPTQPADDWSKFVFVMAEDMDEKPRRTCSSCGHEWQT